MSGKTRRDAWSLRISPMDRLGEPIDLLLTLDGGQTFRWQPRGDGSLEGMASGWRVRVQVDPGLLPGELVVDDEPSSGAGTAREVREAFARLLDLERDYRAARERLLAVDPSLADAVAATRGLRIVRLDPWEAVLSFVLSSHTHIARIKGMLARICQAAADPERPWALPAPEAVAALGERALRRLGLGYRAAYLARTARLLADDPSFLEEGRRLPTPELVQHLQALPGVGEKVAHCIALFGYGRWDAFPIDRWARRALEGAYFGGRSMPVRELQSFVQARFGDLAGLAQAHLFAHARKVGRDPGPRDAESGAWDRSCL